MTARVPLLVAGLLAALAGLAKTAAADTAAARLAFEEANRRFTSAEGADDFLAVAALYQSILDQGVRSGAVLFNQGNAYVRAGELGRAVASYRRAERYLPRDPLLASNLELARGLVGAPPLERRVVDHVVFWRRWLSTVETSWGVLLASVAAFVCGALGLFLGRGFRVAAWCLAVVVVLFGLAFVVDVVLVEWTEHGVVTVDEAVARKGNAASFAPAFTEPLREGSEFTVLDRAGDWVLVELPGGLDGWLPASDVAIY